MQTRCQFLHQSSFRLAIVEGFAGGGRYGCGAPGSPIVFLEALREGTQGINLWRASQGMQPVRIACLLLLNDEDIEAVECLQEAIAPVLGAIRADEPNLLIEVSYSSREWEQIFPEIRTLLMARNFRNVIFNLDQYGHSMVLPGTIDIIMRSFASPEMFLTFAIESWLAFLQTTNPEQLARQLERAGVGLGELDQLKTAVSNQASLGLAEKLVFESLKERAAYVSPFSIHNPGGWRYWMLHLAKSQRARQVYNDVLHDNSSYQAHYGRSGLNMLSYNPRDEAGFLYLFDQSAREKAREQLVEDIPRFISGAGDALLVEDFYEQVYNETPAHADDIKAAILASPELEVRSEHGVRRRKSHQIKPSDVLRFTPQGHFFDLMGG